MKNNKYINSLKNFLLTEKQIGGRRKIYNSLWALLFGIVSSIIILSMTGNNPFEIFQTIFNDAINHKRFATTIVVLIIATLGTGMCFKSGIFNIGISGQMMAAGMTTALIFKLINVSSGTIFLAMFIALLIGAFIAFISAALKAYLNVNIVVTTILMNWIIFYIIKFIIKLEIPGLSTQDSSSQNSTEPFNMPPFFNSLGWSIIMITIAIILVITIWFVFSQTTIGYKMKMLASNKDAAKYAGTNEKAILISVVTISGALSGIAGYLYYSNIGIIQANAQPITIGFDTIAIALLVYNNPFGVAITSVFFAIIKLGCGYLSSKFPPINEDFAQIMFGIIIYTAAISMVFEKFKLFTYLKNHLICWRDVGYKEALKEYRENKVQNHKLISKDKKTIAKIKKENKVAWKQIRKATLINKEKLEKELFVTKEATNTSFMKKLMHAKLFKNKKILIDLNHEEQEYYFSQLNIIKRNQDEQLFQNQFYEIARIRNEYKSLKLQNKNSLLKIKEDILEKNLTDKAKGNHGII